MDANETVDGVPVTEEQIASWAAEAEARYDGDPRSVGCLGRVRVHDSALKHGGRADDALQAATWALWIEDLDDDSPARQLGSGSTLGRLLETVVLVFDSGNELVIHAMKDRPQMYELLP